MLYHVEQLKNSLADFDEFVDADGKTVEEPTPSYAAIEEEQTADDAPTYGSAEQHEQPQAMGFFKVLLLPNVIAVGLEAKRPNSFPTFSVLPLHGVCEVRQLLVLLLVAVLHD